MRRFFDSVKYHLCYCDCRSRYHKELLQITLGMANSMSALMDRVTRHFRDVKLWGRNAKVFVLTEVLWGIPMSWVFFYQVIFMRAIGMDEVFIGFAATLPFAFQTFLPVLGGYLADKFGRKRTLILFDGIGWIGALVLWSIATKPWQIIAAACFQGLSTTTYGVWETMLVEDTDPSYRVSIYSFVQVIYVFGGILTPVAGGIVSLYGVEQGSRYVFLTGLALTAVVTIIYQMYLRETTIGKMLASSRKEAVSGLEGYAETAKTVTRDRKLLGLFIISIVAGIQVPMVNTFKPLYLSDSAGLALDESIISIVPMASSIPSLIALSLIVPRLKPAHMKKALLLSYVCGFLGLVILLTAPKGALVLAILYAILDSARYIATFSILRVFFVNTIDETNPLARAKIMSLITTFSAIASWPTPLIGGYLYAASPILPFVSTAILLILSMLLMLRL